MVVEWGRSCYTSQWHLFRDALELKTTGRYYFSPAGTPHVAGLHHLGSRNWHDTNWRAEVKLGEDLAAKHEWDLGDEPVQLPLNQIIGDRGCLESGELAADSISCFNLGCRFPESCYLPTTLVDKRWYAVSDYNDCSLQKIYAEVITLMYLDQGVLIEALLGELLGVGVTVKYHPQVRDMPAVTTLVHPTWSCAIMNGTTTFQQFATQAFTAIKRPTSYGQFGTVPLWYKASQHVKDTLTADGMVPLSPVMLVGHSYGGAAAAVLAARLRLFDADRLIRILTYGMPKPGDIRLRQILSECDGLHLANDGDLVTIFPPDVVTLFPVMLALGLPGLSVYLDWINAENQVRMSADGALHPNEPSQTDFATLFLWVSNAIAHIPQPFVFEHSITVYLSRISLRCKPPLCQKLVTHPSKLCGTPKQMFLGLPVTVAIGAGELHYWSINTEHLLGFSVKLDQATGTSVEWVIYAFDPCLFNLPYPAQGDICTVIVPPAAAFWTIIVHSKLTTPGEYTLAIGINLCD